MKCLSGTQKQVPLLLGDMTKDVGIYNINLLLFGAMRSVGCCQMSYNASRAS